jgi:hypothetical protein
LSREDLSLDASAGYRCLDVWKDRGFALGKEGHSFEIAADGVALVRFEERA